MRLLKTASGKKVIKIDKREWEFIGKKAGWIDEDNMPSRWELEQEAFEEEARMEYELSKTPKDIESIQSEIESGKSQIHRINLDDSLENIKKEFEKLSQNNKFVEYFYENKISSELFIDFDWSSLNNIENAKGFIKEQIYDVFLGKSGVDSAAEDFLEKYLEDDEDDEDFDSFKENYWESKQEAKDPYGYRGLKRSDF
jgi:hypothetical protein